MIDRLSGGVIVGDGRDLHARHEWNHGFYQVQPSERFSLDISLQRESWSRRMVLALQRPEDLDEVLAARTFIFESDFAEAQRVGLLSGALQGSGLLLRLMGSELEVLSGAPLRHAQEPLLHKALDLLGDLALLGAHLPRLSVRIHNGGHHAHHNLIERIRSLWH